MNIKKEIESLREQIYKAFTISGMLSTIVTVENETVPSLSAEADKLVTALESTALHARHFNEICYYDIQPLENTNADYEKHWAKKTPTGHVEVDENGWLHITLNTLLPHCKYKSNPFLQDTLLRLLQSYKQNAGRLPYFEKAMLIIDEHCNIKNRKIFDQDNKAWKAIPNILKGLVIEDDDQFSLGVWAQYIFNNVRYICPSRI